MFPVRLAPVVSAAVLSWLILGFLSGCTGDGAGSRSHSATGGYTAANDELTFDLPTGNLQFLLTIAQDASP